ncbi:MAG: hypothetical protein U1E51_13710 [Candidatus Binatia bacterium]|nr:hypothetical protein [Candidatus Binatia bacterium]
MSNIGGLLLCRCNCPLPLVAQSEPQAQPQSSDQKSAERGNANLYSVLLLQRPQWTSGGFSHVILLAGLK